MSEKVKSESLSWMPHIAEQQVEGIFHVQGNEVSIDEIESLIDRFREEEKKSDTEDHTAAAYAELLEDALDLLTDSEEKVLAIKVEHFYMPISEFVELKAIAYAMLEVAEGLDLEPENSLEALMGYRYCDLTLSNCILWADLTLHLDKEKGIASFFAPEGLCKINIPTLLFFTMKMWDTMLGQSEKHYEVGRKLLQALEGIRKFVDDADKIINEGREIFK